MYLYLLCLANHLNNILDSIFFLQINKLILKAINGETLGRMIGDVMENKNRENRNYFTTKFWQCDILVQKLQYKKLYIK
ncbi:hypothetical protein BpHYR1_051929 [Brachionus plicatilis]|uniref:Uncharacterized protein n=1 Tax=Brachionus plicatilis TaxID=10195 RepID=A0A3M7SGS4_BRAPC|nr:hypothetical protein BpHYR1_051929 [Brachionus plicatilis]